jgi:RNA polymerase sigma factor (sigma-70 family)
LLSVFENRLSATTVRRCDSNSRQTTRRVRPLGRLRPSGTLPRSGGGPERSGGRGAAGPEAIYPGAPIRAFYINELASTSVPTARAAQEVAGVLREFESHEDLIQEAMLRLHLYAKSDVVVHEEAFLKHAVRNLAIDQYRHDCSRAYREVPIEDVDRQHALIAPRPTPDQILDCQQRLDQLTAILDSVSRRTRQIYFAHRSGYTHAEIANDIGIAEIS